MERIDRDCRGLGGKHPRSPPMAPLKKPWRKIAGMSVTMRARLKEYASVKRAWAILPENQFCRVHIDEGRGKKRAEPTPHHVRGRLSSLLCDTRFWLPVCYLCHLKIHREPAWARAHGYLGPWHKLDDL